MFRSRVVLARLRARETARQSPEQPPKVQSQPFSSSSPPSQPVAPQAVCGIRSRPAMPSPPAVVTQHPPRIRSRTAMHPPTAVVTQPITSIRSPKTALHKPCSTSAASAVMYRLNARRERLAAAAPCPTVVPRNTTFADTSNVLERLRARRARLASTVVNKPAEIESWESRRQRILGPRPVAPLVDPKPGESHPFPFV